jgi:hypothetical protein
MIEKMLAEGIFLGKALFHLQNVAFAGGEEEAVEALRFIAGGEDDASGQTDILHDALQFARGMKDDIPLPPECTI